MAPKDVPPTEKAVRELYVPERTGMADEWKYAAERVAPHSLCCDECRSLRTEVARLREALEQLKHSPMPHVLAADQLIIDAALEGKPFVEAAVERARATRKDTPDGRDDACK